jgi:predicted AlkP superfamily phosphohydrolase/phosphomutase
MTEQNKVLVIGLDGATFNVIKPLLKEGRLPNLKRLVEEGSHGNLVSTTPPLSPVAWTSFITGSNPEKHGIYDFLMRKGNEGYTVKFSNGGDRKVKPIWEIINKTGGELVGIVNVPMSYPPDIVNNFIVSGFDAPGTDSSSMHPSELYDEILERFGNYIIEPLSTAEK